MQTTENFNKISVTCNKLHNARLQQNVSFHQILATAKAIKLLIRLIGSAPKKSRSMIFTKWLLVGFSQGGNMRL